MKLIAILILCVGCTGTIKTTKFKTDIGYVTFIHENELEDKVATLIINGKKYVESVTTVIGVE